MDHDKFCVVCGGDSYTKGWADKWYIIDEEGVFYKRFTHTRDKLDSDDLVCHMACYKFLKKIFKYDLNTNDINRHKFLSLSKDIDYWPFDKYQKHKFDFKECLKDYPQYLQNPHINTESSERIINMWTKFISSKSLKIT